MSKHLSGARGDVRSSALWGTGSRGGEHRSNALWGSSRGGEHRSNALWGKGGRGFITAAVAALTLAVPFAGADSGPGSSGAKGYIPAGLAKKAESNPGTKVHVIVQSPQGVEDAASKVKGEGNGQVKKRLAIVGAVAAEMPAARAAKLAANGYTVTPDARVKANGLSNDQLWAASAGVTSLWSKDAVTCATNLLGVQLDPSCIASSAVVAPAAPSIAVIDSGVQNRADFDGRVIAEVSLVSSGSNAAGDGRGHGTFVAGLAAGASAGYAGAAPNAKIVSVDVMDDAGAGRVSDVIAGAEWVLANKDAYNIRVANFSLGAPSYGSFTRDPLDRAAEKLWFSGIVVVASAGNYGTGGVTKIKNAPANDPFVITVGATDPMGTPLAADDTVAPFSAYGFTYDGFRKPEISAPGRYMVAAIPASSSLATERPDKVVADGYMRLSGTSMAAAVVSGAAAQVLARHPEWTPDQVKGALMVSATPLGLVSDRAGGIGEVNAAAAAARSTAPSANAYLNRFVMADPAGGSLPAFNHSAWYEAATANSAWAESAWAESGWTESAWTESAWTESAWAESAWAESAWTESAWTESAWAESAWTESGWTESAWTESAAGVE